MGYGTFLTGLTVLAGVAVTAPGAPPAAGRPVAKLTLKSREALPATSPLMCAGYLKADGLAMVKVGGYSPDNGRTWESLPAAPDFDKGLPHGYRRESFPLFGDVTNGRVLRVVPSLDTPGLDPKIEEPPIALEAYYLRYRVSVDGGRTFLFDEPIVEKGRTPAEPFAGVRRGRNGMFMGDVGSQVIRTRAGKLLIPAQVCTVDAQGKLWSPGGGFTYTDVMIVIGTWTDGQRLSWEVGDPIQGDPARTTRGVIEPTLAEMPDGRVLCVMRGSNGGSKDPECKLPSYRWCAVSNDGGYRWSKPEPWTDDDGTPFFSPSSMSQLLRHSNGRHFWIGNRSDANCRGNHPRHPLVIGEVDATSLRLIRRSLLAIDDKRPDEQDINLSHWWGFEDRATGDIVIAGARHTAGYRGAQPYLWRIGVE